MPLLFSRWLLLACCLGLWLSPTTHASPVRVTDDQGAVLELPGPPQRIISLLPSLTESVCALHQCQRLVGVDQFSNWPQQVQGLPRLGGLEDAPLEAIVALKPDVVLLAQSARVRPRLQALGVKVLALEPKNMADVQRVLLQLGVLMQVPDATTVWAELQRSLAQAAAAVPPKARGARVYFEVSSEPYAASESSFIGELLTGLGLRNVVPGKLGPFPAINPEFVVRADPDLILVGAGSAKGLEQRPGWAQMRALQQRRWCAFDRVQGDALARPGPRLGEAAQAVVDCLRRQWP